MPISLPRIMMRNSFSALQNALNQKVAEQTASVPCSFNREETGRTIAVLPPMTVTLSMNFTLPLDGGQLPLEQIQSLIRKISGHASSVRNVVVQPSATTEVTESGGQVSAGSPAKAEQVVPTPATARKTTSVVSQMPMTEKQRAMIISMTARKKLRAEAVEAIIQREFGHADGTALTKTEASRLIDRLMAI